LKAVIFDMDGVLADSEPAHFEALRRVLQKNGVPFTFRMYERHFAGRTDEEGLALFLKKSRASVKKLAREKQETYLGLFTGHVRAYSPTVKVARLLHEKRVPLALATSAVRAEANAFLEAFDLKKLFSAIVSGEDVREGKPAPGVYILAAKRVGVAPSDCVVVEDSVMGVEAAKRAGMKCVAVTHSFPEKKLSRADAVVNDLVPGGSKKLFDSVIKMN